MLHLKNISYEIAGQSLFRSFNYSFTKKKYGLVGPNGIGKTTLANILSGRILPGKGTVLREGKVVYFEQRLPPSSQNVEEYLLINNMYESHSQYLNVLLEGIDLGRQTEHLSGGEWMRVRLAKMILEGADFIILDEPSNNLDSVQKTILREFIRSCTKGVLLISHDKELLLEVDTILELSNQGLSEYGGSFHLYSQLQKDEKKRAAEEFEQLVKSERRLERERRDKIEMQEKRMRDGTRRSLKEGLPNILLGARKRRAQETHGKIVSHEKDVLNKASCEKMAYYEQMKIEPFVKFDFEGSAVPSSKIHFSATHLDFRYDDSGECLWKQALSFVMRGQERWVIRGNNGSGKTTLIKFLLNKKLANHHFTGEVYRGNSFMTYLDQNYGELTPELNLLENLINKSRFSVKELRNELALLGFTGDKVYQRVSSLSGGEILRASLAQVFLGPSIPDCIVLDEPTNNLDFSSQELLSTALNRFKGGIIVISHDETFLQELKVDHELELKTE